MNFPANVQHISLIMADFRRNNAKVQEHDVGFGQMEGIVPKILYNRRIPDNIRITAAEKMYICRMLITRPVLMDRQTRR